MQIRPTLPSSPTPLPQATNGARFSESSFSLDSFFYSPVFSFLTPSPYGMHTYPHSFPRFPILFSPPPPLFFFLLSHHLSPCSLTLRPACHQHKSTESHPTATTIGRGKIKNKVRPPPLSLIFLLPFYSTMLLALHKRFSHKSKPKSREK